SPRKSPGRAACTRSSATRRTAAQAVSVCGRGFGSQNHSQRERCYLCRRSTLLLEFSIELRQVFAYRGSDAADQTLNLNPALGLPFPHAAANYRGLPRLPRNYLYDLRRALDGDFHFASFARSSLSDSTVSYQPRRGAYPTSSSARFGFA